MTLPHRLSAIFRAHGVMLIIWLLIGCDTTSKIIPKYQVGEFVRAKLNNQIGQIIARSRVCYNVCLYDVRFSGPEIVTNTRTISGDDPVSILPLSIVKDLREYELEGVQ